VSPSPAQVALALSQRLFISIWRTEVQKEDENHEQEVNKKEVSQRKQYANRENAKKSTGPRTANGKRRVTRNALKDGLYAGEIFVLTEERHEWNVEYRTRLEELRLLYRPAEGIQSYWVQQMAHALVRSRLADRAYAGAVLKLQANALIDTELARQQELISQVQILPFGRERLLLTTSGIDYLLELLTQFAGQVQVGERIANDLREKLDLAFGDHPPKATLDKTAVTFLRKWIRQHRDHLLVMKTQMETREQREFQAQIESDSIPTDADMRRIQRAQSNAHKDYGRALKNLLEAQAIMRADQPKISAVIGPYITPSAITAKESQ
jgi:hypothetical protein